MLWYQLEYLTRLNRGINLKIKNQVIFLSGNAIQRLGEIKLPVKTSLAVARLALKLTDAVKPIEKVRKDIVKEYLPLKKGDDNKEIPLTPEQQSELEKKVNELMEEETDLGEISKIKLPELVSSTCDKCHHNMDKPLEIESNILAILEPFIEA